MMALADEQPDVRPMTSFVCAGTGGRRGADRVRRRGARRTAAGIRPAAAAAALSAAVGPLTIAELLRRKRGHGRRLCSAYVAMLLVTAVVDDGLPLLEPHNCISKCCSC